MKKRSARVVLNRKAIDGVRLAMADGVFAVGKAVVIDADAHSPDATPFGVGLVKRAGTLVYVGDKKVAGWGIDGRQPKKPRVIRLKGTTGIVGIAGFSFPARFQEWGTVDQPARPFFTPARDRIVARIPSIMKQAAAYRIKRLGQ